MSESKSPQTALTELLQKLGEPLPESSIQRTKGSETHKGYDTDGYGYQACVDRFNETLGPAWGFAWEVLKELQGKYSTGKPYFDITVLVKIWIDNPENTRSCVGGHIAPLYADALKGAITNAFKKTAAFWGVGRQAYLGMLDDDNKPLPEEEGKGMRNGGNDKPQGKSQGDRKPQNPEEKSKFDPATKEQRNRLCTIPIYLAVSGFPDTTLDAQIREARSIYDDCDQFGKDKGIETPMPDAKNLSKGRAGHMIKALETMMQEVGYISSDAVNWWNGLNEEERGRYWWWKKVGDNNAPF